MPSPHKLLPHPPVFTCNRHSTGIWIPVSKSKSRHWKVWTKISKWTRPRLAWFVRVPFHRVIWYALSLTDGQEAEDFTDLLVRDAPQSKEYSVKWPLIICRGNKFLAVKIVIFVVTLGKAQNECCIFAKVSGILRHFCNVSGHGLPQGCCGSVWITYRDQRKFFFYY